VAFTSDAQQLVSQRVGGGLAVWDTSTLSRTLLGNSPQEHHFLLVTDSSIVTYGRHVELHRWEDGDLQVLGGHAQRVREAVIDPVTGRIATVDGHGRLRVWSAASDEVVDLDGQGPVAFSPSGRLAKVIGSDVVIVDLETGERHQLVGVDAPIASLAFAPGGDRLAGGIADGGLAVWEIASRQRTDLRRGSDDVLSLRWIDDRTIGSTTVDDLIVWHLDTSRAEVLRGHSGVGFWAVREDSTLVTMGWEGTIRTWRTRSDPVVELSQHEGAVCLVAYATATELVTGGHDGTVRISSLGSGNGRELANHRGKKVTALAVSPDGLRVASADHTGRVQLTALQGGAPITLARMDDAVFVLAWSRDGRLAVGDPAGGLRLFSSEGTPLAEVSSAPQFDVRAAHFAADGEHLVTVGERPDETVSIQYVAIADAEITRSIDLGRDGVLAVAFSTDDRFVAHTSYHRVVHLWDADTGKSRTLGGHDGLIRGARFSEDGQTLATAGDDGVVKLWNVGSGQNRTIVMTQGRLHDVAFSPDGRFFTAVGDERRAFRGRDDLPRSRVEIQRWVSRATNLLVEPQPVAWLSQ
jgi:WD40 repeat protein